MRRVRIFFVEHLHQRCRLDDGLQSSKVTRDLRARIFDLRADMVVYAAVCYTCRVLERASADSSWLKKALTRSRCVSSKSFTVARRSRPDFFAV